MERGLGWRFGKVSSLAEAQACMAERGDHPRAEHRCIREREAYIPIPGSAYRSALFWKDGKPCTIQLEQAECLLRLNSVGFGIFWRRSIGCIFSSLLAALIQCDCERTHTFHHGQLGFLGLLDQLPGCAADLVVDVFV